MACSREMEVWISLINLIQNHNDHYKIYENLYKFIFYIYLLIIYYNSKERKIKIILLMVYQLKKIIFKK